MGGKPVSSPYTERILDLFSRALREDRRKFDKWKATNASRCGLKLRREDTRSPSSRKLDKKENGHGFCSRTHHDSPTHGARRMERARASRRRGPDEASSRAFCRGFRTRSAVHVRRCGHLSRLLQEPHHKRHHPHALPVSRGE